MKVHKDDTVLVISGKNKGKKGRVHRVIPKENRVLVEGVNIVKRHMKPRGTTMQAGIIEKEAPIDASNVMVVCGKCNKPTRIGYRFLDNGNKVRFCKECEEVFD